MRGEGIRLVEHFRDNKMMFWKEAKRVRIKESVKVAHVKDGDVLVFTERNKVCER